MEPTRKCLECSKPGAYICRDCFERIKAHAAQAAADLFEPPNDHPEKITAQWLWKKHPELRDLEEAETYRLFCKAHTISWKDCYGNGSIMWPKWQAYLSELASL